MPERFFVPPGAVTDGAVRIEGDKASHLARSLRKRAGERIVVVEGERGIEHGALLRSVGAAVVEADVVWSRPATGEPSLHITVLQALPSERMDDCIDVLVQAGAAEIRPVFTERVVTRLTEERVAGRLRRWRAIAAEAAQLAGRGRIPQVHAPADLGAALAELPPSAQRIACTFDGERSVAALQPDAGRPLALCIGPEGGLGDADLDTLRRAGAGTAHLGARVVRTRYAGAVACALLLASAGDLEAPVAVAPWAAPL